MNSAISVSIMCANPMLLQHDIDLYEKCNIEYVHIDIMDNVFVPNMMLPPCWVNDIHRSTDIPFDYHLMMYHPESLLNSLLLKEDDYVSIHVESTPHLQRVLSQVRDLGAKPAVALNPATPITVIEEVLPDIEMVLLMTVNPGFAGQKLIPQALDKIKKMRRYLDERGYDHIPIEVDGNCSFENSKLMREKGADIFVSGTSSVYTKDMSFETACRQLRQMIS